MNLRASFVFLGLFSLAAAAAPPKPSLPVYAKIPAFQLIDQTGTAFSSENLKDRVWIADFIFTRCAGVCPMMSGRMRSVQNRLSDLPEIRLISFSVDPDYDTPQVLEKYAARFEAVPGRWYFLTGAKETIYQLSQQHFLLGVGEVPEAEQPDAGQAVQHSSKFVLVDQAGQIRGYYDTESEGAVDQLVRDARALAASGASEDPA